MDQKESQYIYILYKSAEIKLQLYEEETIDELKSIIYDITNVHPYFQQLSEEYGSNSITSLQNNMRIRLDNENHYLKFETEFGFILTMRVRQKDKIGDLKKQIEKEYNIDYKEQNFIFKKVKFDDENKTFVDYFEKYDKKNLFSEESGEDKMIIKHKTKENINLIIYAENKQEKLSINPFDTIKNLYDLLSKKLEKEINLTDNLLVYGNDYLVKKISLIKNYIKKPDNNFLTLIESTKILLLNFI